MLFRLTNALAAFVTLINKLLHDYLNKFIVVYLDDSLQPIHRGVRMAREVGE